MKKLILIILVLFPAICNTQEANPPYLAFRLDNTTTVFTQAANFIYHVDGNSLDIYALWTDCHDESPNVECIAPLPPLGPGLHSLTLTYQLGPRSSVPSEPVQINLYITSPFNLSVK
jgi:hypothetical protein